MTCHVATSLGTKNQGHHQNISISLAVIQYQHQPTFQMTSGQESLPVIEGDDKVEEVGLPQVGRGLLLKMGSPNSRAADDIGNFDRQSIFVVYNLFG